MQLCHLDYNKLKYPSFFYYEMKSPLMLICGVLLTFINEIHTIKNQFPNSGKLMINNDRMHLCL